MMADDAFLDPKPAAGRAMHPVLSLLRARLRDPGAGNLTMIDDDLDRAGGGYRMERSIGTTAGISVEVWRSMISSDVDLVVFPAVKGFRVIASGGMAEIDLLATMGGAVLRALEATGPLLSGEWFRGSRNGITEQVQPGVLK